jgi:hypothetical protein
VRRVARDNVPQSGIAWGTQSPFSIIRKRVRQPPNNFAADIGIALFPDGSRKLIAQAL